MKGFRQFILRGNVVDLAVGVVIGAAFAALITAFGAAFLKPLIALFVGTKECDVLVDAKCEQLGAHFTVNGQNFLYGDFLTAVFTFLITAAVLYFFVVRPINHLMDRYKSAPAPSAPTKDCTECLSTIPQAAARCAFCTSKQPVKV